MQNAERFFLKKERFRYSLTIQKVKHTKIIKIHIKLKIYMNKLAINKEKATLFERSQNKKKFPWKEALKKDCYFLSFIKNLSILNHLERLISCYMKDIKKNGCFVGWWNPYISSKQNKKNTAKSGRTRFQKRTKGVSYLANDLVWRR